MRASDLADEWVRAGHEVRLLTGFPNHPEGVLHSDYRRQWRSPNPVEFFDLEKVRFAVLATDASASELPITAGDIKRTLKDGGMER